LCNQMINRPVIGSGAGLPGSDWDLSARRAEPEGSGPPGQWSYSSGSHMDRLLSPGKVGNNISNYRVTYEIHFPIWPFKWLFCLSKYSIKRKKKIMKWRPNHFSY
jgi:hypothetical protein